MNRELPPTESDTESEDRSSGSPGEEDEGAAGHANQQLCQGLAAGLRISASDSPAS